MHIVTSEATFTPRGLAPNTTILGTRVVQAVNSRELQSQPLWQAAAATFTSVYATHLGRCICWL